MATRPGQPFVWESQGGGAVRRHSGAEQSDGKWLPSLAALAGHWAGVRQSRCSRTSLA